MRKRYTCISFLIIIILIISGSRAFAVGLGFFFDYSHTFPSGIHHSYEEYVFYGPEVSLEEHATVELQTFGVGFVFDTAHSNDSLINFRSGISLFMARSEFTSNFLGSDDALGGGIRLEINLGLAAIRSAPVRIWLGPHAAYSLSITNYWIGQYSVGGVLGFDFAGDNNRVYSVTAGYRYSLMLASDRIIFAENAFSGYDHSLFVQISFLFRRGE